MREAAVVPRASRPLAQVLETLAGEAGIVGFRARSRLRRAHAHLERAERMLDGLTPSAHRSRVFIEPLNFRFAVLARYPPL